MSKYKNVYVIKGILPEGLVNDEYWITDLLTSLEKEYSFFECAIVFNGDDNSYFVNVVHLNNKPISLRMKYNIRGHVQGWMHGAGGYDQ